MAGHFAKFVSLARTPEELKRDAEKNGIGPNGASKMEQPIYPYGLCLYLDDETLKKLDLELEGCEVGSKIHLCCMAEVTDYSERKTNEGVKNRIELQITDMALEDEDKENTDGMGRSERMKNRYGISDGDAGDADDVEEDE